MTYLKPRPGHKPRFLFLFVGDTCLLCCFHQACGKVLIHSFTPFLHLRKIYVVIVEALCQALGAP